MVLEAIMAVPHCITALPYGMPIRAQVLFISIDGLIGLVEMLRQ